MEAAPAPMDAEIGLPVHCRSHAGSGQYITARSWKRLQLLAITDAHCRDVDSLMIGEPLMFRVEIPEGKALEISTQE
jgi:hypothetical protein